MAVRLKGVDCVLVGFGWTAALLGQELTEAGLQVLALERGPDRQTATDFNVGFIQDELRYAVRHETFEEPARTTLSFRNKASETALPMRHLGSFNPGIGVGGAGIHWNGQHRRCRPTDLVLRSHTEQRYGSAFIPPDMTIQDWGVTYAELEPYFDKFEYLCGVSGVAGNVQGTINPAGNPFEGARAREFPNPPLKRSRATQLFDKAARELGFHPFAAPASNTSRPYKNPLGVQMGSCTYCGFCEWFGCGNYSKASPQSTILPVLTAKSNFSYRTNANVTRINVDSTVKRATGVTYVDTDGREFEQPAELVILCAYGLHNTHLLLLSKIGRPYDPQTGEGVIGRNYAYQITSSVNVFMDEILNPFMGAGALGQAIDDFNGDNFDHGPVGFLGGGYIAAWTTGGRPISQQTMVPEGTPKWGSAWKKAISESYLRSFAIATHGSVMSYRNSYLDLDPTYRDAYGNPLLRLTFDYHDNELKMSRFLTGKAKQIASAVGAKSIKVNERTGPYSIVPYQTTHNTGGAIMGSDPRTSAINRYLQSWDVPNLFVMGASAFPQNHGYNPTGTVGALTYWAAAAIREQYLKQPGKPLVAA